MWISPRVGIGRAAVTGFFGQTDDHPLVVLVLHMIPEGHRWRRRLALGRHRDGGVRLLPVELHIGDLDVHSGDVIVAFGEVIDHTLTHRVGVFLAAALAGGEAKNQEQGGDKTHKSIIP